MLLSAVALLLGWGHVGDHVQLFGPLGADRRPWPSRA